MTAPAPFAAVAPVSAAGAAELAARLDSIFVKREARSANRGLSYGFIDRQGATMLR